MKRYIVGVVTGLVLSGAIAFAVNYTATDNPFPIRLNGENIELEGYNIDGSTYFKLRDIADKVGGFSVDFQNNTIQLAKDGYVYDNEPSVDYSKYIGEWVDETDSLGRNLYGLTINAMDGQTADISLYRMRGKNITYNTTGWTFYGESEIRSGGSYGFIPYGNEFTQCTYSIKLGENVLQYNMEDANGQTESAILYKVSTQN